ncbi:MAG: hypothetical protein LQ340_004559 [Diploschistes diacapsis]|nr:MAG: hypothetical protein LQ340_004559 [Diploschistes diacapsis]
MVAAYYTFVDCILVSQFIYFTYFLKKEDRWMAAVADDVGNQGPGARGDGPLQALNPKPSRAVNISRDPIFDTFRFPTGSPSPREKSLLSTSRPLVNSASSGPTASPKTVILVCTLLAVLAHASPLPSAEAPSDHLPPPASSTSETAGQIISWFSTFLYLGSRLPQLIKNHRRKSTSGLSASLFIAAFFGNLFYSSSLLSNPLAWGSYGPHGLYGWAPPEGSDRSKWVALATPFFLGAAGVLALDAAVGMQFLMYGEGSEEQARKKLVEYRDDTGARHWRKVSGWMRGWVPSPRLRPVRTDSVTSFGGLGDAVVNDQRPLLDRDDEEDSLAGRNYGSGGRAR